MVVKNPSSFLWIFIFHSYPVPVRYFCDTIFLYKMLLLCFVFFFQNIKINSFLLEYWNYKTIVGFKYYILQLIIALFNLHIHTFLEFYLHNALCSTHTYESIVNQQFIDVQIKVLEVLLTAFIQFHPDKCYVSQNLTLFVHKQA
jgi:hypothetical protein